MNNQGLFNLLIDTLNEEDGDYCIPHRVINPFDESNQDCRISIGEDGNYEIWISNQEGICPNPPYHLRRVDEWHNKETDSWKSWTGLCDSDNRFEILDAYKKATPLRVTKRVSHTEITEIRFSCGNLPKNWVEFHHTLKGKYTWSLVAADDRNGYWSSEDVNKHISKVEMEDRVLRIEFYNELSEGYDHTDILIRQAISYG